MLIYLYRCDIRGSSKSYMRKIREKDRKELSKIQYCRDDMSVSTTAIDCLGISLIISLNNYTKLNFLVCQM